MFRYLLRYWVARSLYDGMKSGNSRITSHNPLHPRAIALIRQQNLENLYFFDNDFAKSVDTWNELQITRKKLTEILIGVIGLGLLMLWVEAHIIIQIGWLVCIIIPVATALTGTAKNEKAEWSWVLYQIDNPSLSQESWMRDSKPKRKRKSHENQVTRIREDL